MMLLASNVLFNVVTYHLSGSVGTSGGFQRTPRDIWATTVPDTQGLWQHQPSAFSSYMVALLILLCLVKLLPSIIIYLLYWLELSYVHLHLFHCSFNQLDLPEYTSKEQLQERLLLAIHEANEGFGFG
jgi:hypothetical protein